MANKVVHFKSIGAVTFFRTRRAKNMKISVKPDKTVLVSFPDFVSEKEVLAFLSRNEEWIEKQRDKVEDRRTSFSDDTVITTKWHKIKLHRGDSYHAYASGNEIEVFVEDFHSERTREFIDRFLAEVYRHEARKLLPPRLREQAARYGFEYNRVTIRNNKRNWGSCSSRNNISLNLQMMKLPDELIDYVLLHELVHTEIKNHSPNFWARLNEVTQNRARELAMEVRKYSTYTL